MPPFRCDRSVRYGGVTVYVSSKITATRLTDLEFQSIESVWLCIEVGSKNLILGTYYRPPGQPAEERNTFLTAFSTSVESALQLQPSALFVVGDFNDRCSEWDSSHATSELGLNFYNLVQTLSLYQLKDTPTRVTPTTNSLLDLIITD